MRKSRVVNLCDNILCETFLFLVQRELQRSTEHGARRKDASHTHAGQERDRRQAGVLGSL